MSSSSVGIVAWLTGRPGAGKSTLASAASSTLRRAGSNTLWLDGARVRSVAAPELGFAQDDCTRFDARFMEVVRDAAARHDFVIVSATAPSAAYRAWARSVLPRYVEVFVTASADLLAARDPKGMYAKVRAGVMESVPGIDAPYDEPTCPDLVLNSESHAVEKLANELVAFLRTRAAAKSGDHAQPHQLDTPRYP